MENISSGPTLGDFVTIFAKGSMQDFKVARLQNTKVYRLPSPTSNKCKVWYCVRVSPRTVKIYLALY